jgi:hypothetical protein
MKKSFAEQMNEAASTPVPFEAYAKATEAFERAARGDDPADHLPGGPRPGDEPGGLYLTNIPINRGMMAARRAVGDELSEIQTQSMLLRLMHFGDSLESAQQDVRFAEHVKASDESGLLDVSEAFMRVYAECAFEVEAERMGPDMDDLFRLAERYRED